VASSLAAGCGNPTPTGEVLVSYQRAWPDGYVERQTIWADGRIEMHHGERVERFSIRQVDLERVTSALEEAIPTGSPVDSPVRVLTLPDGTIVMAPRPEPGTVTELLDRLIETHST
jgi:hypothetical protein